MKVGKRSGGHPRTWRGIPTQQRHGMVGPHPSSLARYPGTLDRLTQQLKLESHTLALKKIRNQVSYISSSLQFVQTT